MSEMLWTSPSSLTADIWVWRCDLTLRWLEGRCSKWDFHCCWRPEVVFRLCTAHSPWPLISQRRPSASTKAALLHRLHSQSCIIFFLPLSFCSKKNMEPNQKYDLSVHYTLYTIIRVRKMGSQSLLKSYISPPIMYIKGFSLPPVEMFVLLPIQPQCTWIS